MIKGVKSLAVCISLLCFMAAPALAQKATMTAPANGSKLATIPTFTWSNAGAGADYYLYIGTTLGGIEKYKVYCGTDLSATVPGLPADNNTVYVRLWTRQPTKGWYYNDYSFIGRGATPAYAGATITSPATGAAISGTVTFNIDNSTGGSAYLFLGSSSGASNYAWINAGHKKSVTFKVPPTWANNLPIYASLSTQFGRFSSAVNYTYFASNPAMFNPAASGDRLAKPAVFNWVDANSTLNCLQIGSTLGGSEFYKVYVGTDETATVPGLPYDNSNVYVRLWCQVNSVWVSKDYVYLANNTGSTDLAKITSPVDNSTIDNATSSVTFVWDNATKTKATNYQLYVGTTPGARNLYQSGNLGTVNTKTISNKSFPKKSRVYATIYTYIGNFVKSLSFSYKTKNGY